MKSKDIARVEWKSFFDNLSRRQEGWEVGLEVFSPEIGDQIEGRNIFLAGMTAEVTERGDKIEIMLAHTPGSHVTHVIGAPTKVDLQQTDLGIDSAVRIESADGTTSLLHLRSL